MANLSQIVKNHDLAQEIASITLYTNKTPSYYIFN